MRLTDILKNIKIIKQSGTTNKDIKQLCFDSRKAQKGTLFFAIVGTQTDGHQYIQKAIDKGATAIVCEQWPEKTQEDITYLQVTSSAKALGWAASHFYGHPSRQLKLVGITGTNGKTTTATLLYKLFRQLNYHVGLLSTIQHYINERVVPANFTTPDALTLNALLAEMVEEGCEYCFMEVSSHAVAQERIAGLTFAGGIFSNITHDHLDFHKTFSEYIKAKKRFFDQLPKDAFALSNIDDKRGTVMLQNTKASKYTYALKSAADFKAKILENTFAGLLLNLDGQEIYTRLIGEFNAYNLLAIYATAILLGEEKLDVLTKLSNLTTAEGRFDYITKGGIIGIVDYAHTPDALLKVLSTIQNIRKQEEQLITIVGCGGDRDRAKRPKMAAVACRWSDRVILTSDNPRTEVPEAIIADMQTGVVAQHQNKTLSITNRREAIKAACLFAQSGDIILVAGKGHEKYQEINKVKHPFDDKQVLLEYLQT